MVGGFREKGVLKPGDRMQMRRKVSLRSCRSGWSWTPAMIGCGMIQRRYVAVHSPLCRSTTFTGRTTLAAGPPTGARIRVLPQHPIRHPPPAKAPLADFLIRTRGQCLPQRDTLHGALRPYTHLRPHHAARLVIRRVCHQRRDDVKPKRALQRRTQRSDLGDVGRHSDGLRI